MEYEEIVGDEMEMDGEPGEGEILEGFDDEIEVKIIRRSGDAVLVAWIDDGNYRRATVPLLEIDLDISMKVGVTDKQTLELGIPYGLPWEEIIGEIKITPKIIANTLRQYGIWTYKDVQKRPNSIVGALQAAYGIDLAAINRGARNLKEK